MLRKIIFIIVFLLLQSSFLFSQQKEIKLGTLSYNNHGLSSVSIGPSGSGLFVSPLIGLEFPFSTFHNTAKPGFVYGVKLEFASKDIYPFIIGGLYSYQLNKGNEDYKSINRLDVLETTINSFGMSIDVILNKYIKSEFTIPFITLEAKYLTIQREISPATNNLGLATSESTFGFTGGLGVTLYIFDIYGTYTYAKNYNTFAVKTRFHFPLIKF